MRALFLYHLHEARGAIIGWSIGLAAFIFLIAISFLAVEGEESLDDLYESFGELEGFFGDCVTLTEFDCYMDTQIVAYLPVIMGIFAVIHASRLLAGDEETGRLDITLSLPVSRTQLVLAHVAVLLVAQAVVGLAVGVTIALSALMLGETDMILGGFLVGLNVWPAVWFIAIATYAISAFAHRRRLASMGGTALLVGSYVWGGLAPIIDAGAAKWLSFTYLYQQSNPMRDGFDAAYFLITLAVTALLAVVAWLRFDGKDLTG